ncbi:hypothetical protein [uncultured Draconibacterium sp.]|uniref:hypothetical protein n=1 Tax=uncultured Draconibacterium sp. TaxID=1573823 RepID=UPI0037481E71
MKTKKSSTKSNKLLPLTIIGIILLTKTSLFAQNTEWGIDEIKRIEQEKKHEHDSLMVHLKNNWQISLCYGQWNFNNSSKSRVANVLDFPNNMGIWNLSVARYFSETIALNANFGVQIKKIEPIQPNFFSIINGDDIEIEGGGVIFLPFNVGLDYFLMKQRFRPYIGVGVGFVSANSKLAEASGNMYDGINADELESSSNAPFIEVSSGFVYRSGKNTQLGLNCEYVQSTDFDQNIGGFKSYSGLKISGVFSIVF